MSITADNINQLLPQTQCRECGFSGCLPYAEALANNAAELNLCAAGGEIVMLDLANLLQRPTKQPEKIQPNWLILMNRCVLVVRRVFGRVLLMRLWARPNSCTPC